MAIFISKKTLEAEIAKRTAETCEQIISEMGAELHDDLIQKLSVLRLYVDQMERASGDQAEIDVLSIRIRSDFDQVIHVVRNISRRLLPVKMEGETLDKTLALLCQNMEYPGAGHIHFENNGTPVILESQTARYLFRIVQELIHNAFKHSSAWHIWVRLNWSPGNLVIEVEDDGTGFSKIPNFIKRLKRKNNTVKLRSTVIGANIKYSQGQKGLLAKLVLQTETRDTLQKTASDKSSRG